MNVKTTLVLLALALLVAGFFIWQQRAGTDLPDADGPARLAGAALWDDVSTDDITGMVIQRGQERLVLARQAGAWWQVEPVRFPLDPWQARRLAAAVAELRYTEKLAPGSRDAPPLAQLGLEPPRASITLTLAGEATSPRTLHLGERTPVGGKGFVSLEGAGEAYLVGDALHREVLEGKVEEWRQQVLDAPPEGRADRLVIRHAGQTAEAVKTDGRWVMAGQTLAGRADSDVLRSLLTALGSTRVVRFVADAPANLSVYGLDEPATVVQVEAAEPPPLSDEDAAAPAPARRERVVLQIGSPVDFARSGYFATWARTSGNGEAPGEGGAGQVVFEIARADAERFARTPDDLRDARLSTLRPGEVRELLVEGRETYRAVRGPGGNWEFAPAGPQKHRPPFPADSSQVAELIEAITEARGSGFAAPAEPAETPAVAVTLTAVGRPEPEVLRLFAAGPDAKQWLVLRNHEPLGYRVPIEKLARVMEPVVTLRERTVVDLPADRVNRITLQQADGTQLLFERELPASVGRAVPASAAGAGPSATASAAWTLAGHQRFELDALEDLLAELFPLRAEKWLAEPGPAPRPGLATIVLQTPGDESATVRIDPATRAAAAGAVDHGFQVSGVLVERLSAEFRDRTLLPIAEADIRRVTIRRPGPEGSSSETLALERSADGEWIEAGGQELNANSVRSFIDALAGLRVERYLRAQPPASPSLSIELELADDRRVGLAFPALAEEPYTGYRRGGWGDVAFRLDEAAYRRLSAPLQGESHDEIGWQPFPDDAFPVD